MLPLVQLLYLAEVLALSGQILYVFEDFFLALLEPMHMRNNLLLFLFTLIDSITQNTGIHQMDIPYLPVYKSIPCISRPPILGPKNTFFLFLCPNFLEKLLFYLRISFKIRNGFMKKNTPSLDVKFTISLT